MDADLKNKAARNERHYQKLKETTDTFLLRLPKGGKKRVGQMAAHFGVARPALFDLYLLPFLGVIATHQRELSGLARTAGCSMPTLLEGLSERASNEVDEAHPQEVAPEVGSQLDALFGGPSEDGIPSDAGGL